ncbi:MAG: RidA family protein [Planctomycetota bacterium]
MRPIEHESIPRPAGHYSPIVEHAGVLYVSGQLPMDPETKDVPDGVEAQCRLALENVERLLRAAGVDRTHLIQVRVYVSDLDHWGRVNDVYAEFMGEHRPARVVVPTGPLHHGCLVEIEATAALRAGAPFE